MKYMFGGKSIGRSGALPMPVVATLWHSFIQRRDKEWIPPPIFESRVADLKDSCVRPGITDINS